MDMAAPDRAGWRQVVCLWPVLHRERQGLNQLSHQIHGCCLVQKNTTPQCFLLISPASSSSGFLWLSSSLCTPQTPIFCSWPTSTYPFVVFHWSCPVFFCRFILLSIVSLNVSQPCVFSLPWLTDWVEFNIPPNTLYVISGTILAKLLLQLKITSQNISLIYCVTAYDTPCLWISKNNISYIPRRHNTHLTSCACLESSDSAVGRRLDQVEKTGAKSWRWYN